MTSYPDREVETKDEGETMLDSITGSLVLTGTARGSKGGMGTGSSDRCADELGREWKGIMGRASGETPLGEVELVVEVPSVLVSHSIQRIVRRNPPSPTGCLAIGKIADKR